MAAIKLTIGAVNITDYLMVLARKTTDLSVIAAQETYSPTQLATPLNVIVPATGNIDAAIYSLEFRESADGIVPGLLLAKMIYDAKRQIPVSETRYYRAGGTRLVDPTPGQANLVDPYLDGKNITAVYKTGVGPLAPQDSGVDVVDYNLITGGGIHLLNSQTFNNGELMVVVITYILGVETTEGNQSLYNSVLLFQNDTQLLSIHRNNKIQCESLGQYLTITLEDVNTVPERVFYMFFQNGGFQSKTKIIGKTSQLITFQGQTRPYMSFGKGQYIRIEKYNGHWEVTMVHAGIGMIGEEFVKGVNPVINALAQSGQVIDGDIEPGLAWYVYNDLPSTHVIIDNTLSPQPSGKEGMFVRHSDFNSSNDFRMPNVQNFAPKALKNFSNYGTDTTRAYDYPGGSAPENAGMHAHFTLVNKSINDGGFPTSLQNLLRSVVRYFNKSGGAESAYLAGSDIDYERPTISPSSGPITLPSGPTSGGAAGTPAVISGDMAVKNIGKIYFIRS